MNNNNSKILTDKYNEDFNTALNIYENSYSHDYLIELLKNGSVVEKQVATLKIDKINNKKEAEILGYNDTLFFRTDNAIISTRGVNACEKE